MNVMARERTRSPSVGRRPTRPGQRADSLAGYALSTPFFVLLGIFVIYPVLTTVRLSFMEFSFLNPDASKWIGLANYADILKDETFRSSMRNTLVLMALVVPIQTSIALLLANGLNARLKARGLFRTIYFLPYITPPVAVSAVMIALFSPGALISKFLHGLFGTADVAWYSSRGYAFVLVVLVMVWTQVGFFTLIYLAGLQAIPQYVYEAAAIDGANPAQILRRITVPLLKPTTFLVVVLGIIITLQVFEQPFVISTTGGRQPGSPADTTLTMVMFLYTEAFRYFHMGRASAAAFVVFVLIASFTVLQLLMQRRARA